MAFAQDFWTVFAHAAMPQKMTLVLLGAAIPAIMIFAVLALRADGHVWRRIVSDLRIAGPVVGLLIAGLNSFHMADTIRKLPLDPTLKQLAPGIFEVSAFLIAGAAVGVAAVVADGVVSLRLARRRGR